MNQPLVVTIRRKSSDSGYELEVGCGSTFEEVIQIAGLLALKSGIPVSGVFNDLQFSFIPFNREKT